MLHVDEEQFSRHLMRDAFFSEKIEKLAMNLHSNSELFQLKLNIETSGGDSTPPEAKSGNSTL